MRGIKSDYCGICGQLKSKYLSGRTRCLNCERQKRNKWRSENIELARKIGREQQRKRREGNPRKNRDEQWEMMLRREYNISVLQYHDMFERQKGLCAICGSFEPRHSSGRLVVDHNHDTGEVRGLLCGWCNSAIGYLGDNPNILGRLEEYLRKGGENAVAE